MCAIRQGFFKIRGFYEVKKIKKYWLHILTLVWPLVGVFLFETIQKWLTKKVRLDFCPLSDYWIVIRIFSEWLIPAAAVFFWIF